VLLTPDRMTDSEAIVLFAAAMLAMAIFAIAVDWIGKPIRRRFVPKIFRYPEELAGPPDPSRTAWSDSTFVVPENPPLGVPIEYPDGSTEWSDSLFVVPDAHPSTRAAVLEPGLVPIIDIDTADEPDTTREPAPIDTADEPDTTREPAPIDTADEPDTTRAERPVPVAAGAVAAAPTPGRRLVPERSTGWRPGQYVFNRTRDGNEPRSDVVRSRFWKNIGISDHAGAFGDLNSSRLSTGKAPARRNPRSGKTELMHLDVTTFEEAAGRPPVPSWPGDELDPFAGS